MREAGISALWNPSSFGAWLDHLVQVCASLVSCMEGVKWLFIPGLWLPLLASWRAHSITDRCPGRCTLALTQVRMTDRVSRPLAINSCLLVILTGKWWLKGRLNGFLKVNQSRWLNLLGSFDRVMKAILFLGKEITFKCSSNKHFTKSNI